MKWLDRGADWVYERVKGWRTGYVWLLAMVVCWGIAVAAFMGLIWILRLLICEC